MTMSHPSADHPLTAQGTIMGTFQYMSPEQTEGKEADARSDIFAMGALLYEMVTGKRAFTGQKPGQRRRGNSGFGAAAYFDGAAHVSSSAGAGD